MKYLLSLFICLVVLSACKEESSTPEDGEMTLTIDEVRYKGDYIHIGDAAVLSTPTEIYAVQVDEKSAALDLKAKEFQKTPYDMVKVILTGDLVPNPYKDNNGEGWDQMLKIEKIVEVKAGTMQTVQQESVELPEDN